MSDTPYRTDRFAQLVLIVAFVVFLFVPFLGQLVGFSGSELIRRIEYRSPAPVPDWPGDREALRQLPDGVDAYVNDFFGFRSQLVWLNSGLQYLLGASGSERVLIGSDGWLFLRTRHQVVEEYRGLVDIPDSEIDAWVESMVRRRDWLAKRGIPFVLAIPPVKHTVYPEFLPDWVVQVGPNRLDRTIETIRSDTDLAFADLRQAILDEKTNSGELLYYRRGTHWNYRGAFAGYSEVMKKVNAIFPELPVIERDDIEYWVNGTRVGDLTRMLHLDEDLQEPFLDVRLLGRSNVRKVEILKRDGLVRGNVGHTERESVTSVAYSVHTDRPKALIIRDSFTNAMAPYFRETFGTTIFAHHRQNRFDRALVDLFQPDIVIFVIVEKALYYEPKDVRSRKIQEEAADTDSWE